jgi:hypothetical protein
VTREELITAIARAMAECEPRSLYGDAVAALAAIEAAGVRLVYPSEAQAQLIDGDERTTVRIFTPYASE